MSPKGTIESPDELGERDETRRGEDEMERPQSSALQTGSLASLSSFETLACRHASHNPADMPNTVDCARTATQPSHRPRYCPFLAGGAPLTAALAGPQLACGFIWYLTTLTSSRSLLPASGWCARLTSCRISLPRSTLAGDPSLTLDILTGCVLIHSRMTSCTNVRGASVLIEPATACEREMV